MSDSSKRPFFFATLIAGLVVIGLLMVVLMAIGLVYIGAYAPDTKVLPASKLPPRQLATIRDVAGLKPAETILMFYSDAMTFEGDGNLLTDQRVISYSGDDDGITVDSTPYSEITAVDLKRGESWLDDSTITVTCLDGRTLVLYASIERDGDVTMADAIQSRMPAETVPAETVPAETVPAEAVPIEAVPIEAVPIEAAPAEVE